MFLGLLGAAGSLFSAVQKPPEIPQPARPPDAARTPNATVRVGTRDEGSDEDKTANPGGPFVKTRVGGRSLGNLGRSGLSI